MTKEQLKIMPLIQVEETFSKYVETVENETGDRISDIFMCTFLHTGNVILAMEKDSVMRRLLKRIAGSEYIITLKRRKRG